MNLTTNNIPENWNPNDKISFMNWMIKIQSNYYNEIN